MTRSSGVGRSVLSKSVFSDPISQPLGVRCHSVHSLLYATVKSFSTPSMLDDRVGLAACTAWSVAYEDRESGGPSRARTGDRAIMSRAL